jgi:hypothetical protein
VSELPDLVRWLEGAEVAAEAVFLYRISNMLEALALSVEFAQLEAE